MARLIDTINRRLAASTAAMSDLTKQIAKMEEATRMLKYRLANAEAARQMALDDLVEVERNTK